MFLFSLEASVFEYLQAKTAKQISFLILDASKTQAKRVKSTDHGDDR